MTYQIVRISPVYHPIYDGIVGSQSSRLPNAYETEALPRKLAARWEEESYGDCIYYVIPFDGDMRRDRIVTSAPISMTDDDDIPF